MGNRGGARYGSLDVGVPGASARARADELARRAAQRRRAQFGALAPVLAVFMGPDRVAEAWRRGADGEVMVGRRLTDAVDGLGVVLHDRRLGHGRANIDHLVIVPSGVWVVDAKRYRGRLRRWDGRGSLFVDRPTVGGHDLRGLAASVQHQSAVVSEQLPDDVAVQAALCFAGVERSLLSRPFIVDGTHVTWPRALARELRQRGPLGPKRREELASHLARAFPPYAPSGTSHKPTGAPPRG